MGTWRESKPHSEIVGHHEVSEAQNVITELVDYLEPEARRGRHIRDNLVSIVRILDRERAAAQNAALEGHLAPSMGGPSIDEVITDTLPEELRPGRLQSDEATEQGDDDLEGMDLIIEDDAEALEPADPLMNDGGTE